MKKLSYILAALGVALAAYAVVARFAGGSSTAFGYICPVTAGTVGLGANTLLLLAILAAVYAKDQGQTPPSA